MLTLKRRHVLRRIRTISIWPTTPTKTDNIRFMKIGSIYVPWFVVGSASVGAVIVALTFAGVMAFLPLWASSALCGAALMAVAFLAHYILRARHLASIVWHNLPDFVSPSNSLAEDVSSLPNPTADPLHLPNEMTLFFMTCGGAFFGLLFTLSWLRWIGVAVAIVGAIIYAIYDYMPRFDRDSRPKRRNRKKEKTP
jgi:drug/metabolite transporter (DMT)-like permease